MAIKSSDMPFMLSLLLFMIISTYIIYYIIDYSINGILTEGFEDASFKSDKVYTTQVQLLTDTYSDTSNGKRPLLEGIKDMPDSDQIFTNFYSLGCRFTGFIGPKDDSYYDPDIAVQNAVAAGCRVFVLEIDYKNHCRGESEFFPTLVVRDIKGRLIINDDSNKPKCNSVQMSNIRTTCEKINFYAFSSSCQNATDPVVLVLYFLRQPPGTYNSTVVLNYFSNVAKMIAPLSNRFLQNEATGTYYRQKQEGQLLMNKITSYNRKVLVFSNANTSGFRENNNYPANEDLDFLVNLRLSYTQTKLGITDNTAGSTFGILETAENYMIVPSDRSETVVADTKLKWTICLSTDPLKSVPKETYNLITSTFGVHCVPIIIYDTENQYMFTDELFKKYSFIPKPAPLRYTKPPIIVPADPNPSMNANKGFLREPTI